MIWRVEPTSLEAAQRELTELYRRLALVRPLSRNRIGLQMQIARVRRRITPAHAAVDQRDIAAAQGADRGGQQLVLHGEHARR